MEYQDILYVKENGIATITINRPNAYNAFRANTCEEMIHAFKDADFDKSIGVVVLTGAGDKAFCTGGDQGTQEGGYGGRGTIGLPIEEVQSAIRDIPKPVIARVNGFADRRRQRAGDALRPGHRVGKGAVGSGRAEGRLGRSGLRHRLPGAGGRREEGAGDLVPVPPLHGPGGAGHGHGERRRAARPVGRRSSQVVRGNP